MSKGQNFGSIEFMNEDCVVVSYPKSGNTWMRFLIFSYLFDRQATFEDVKKTMPYIPPEWRSETTSVLSKITHLVFKSHENWPQRYSKVIYIVRDPRDIVLSLYFWHRKTGFFDMPENKAISDGEYIDKFLFSSYLWPVPWDKHVEGWIDGGDKLSGSFLFVKYENMLANIKTQFRRVIDFLGLQLDQQKLERAISRCSLSKMQQVENKRKNEIPFARKGKSGQWEGVLNQTIVRQFSERFGSTMEKMGYRTPISNELSEQSHSPMIIPLR